MENKTKQNKDLQKQVLNLKAENAELQAKIKKYASINEQETKDYAELKHTLKLQEQENVRLREKFNNLISTPIYENCNLLLEQKRRLEKCLQEIKAIVTEPCIDNENCLTCKSNCMNKDILQLITKAEEEWNT